MQRKLILNWCEEHESLRRAVVEEIENPLEVPDTGKGWTYLTFFEPGTKPEEVLFDVDRLRTIAHDNGFFLPREVVTQHNKVVVTASSTQGASAQLFGIHRFLLEYAARYRDVRKWPLHGFYGKFGGTFNRAEKGRALALYARGDDALLEILQAAEALVDRVEVPGVRFGVHLSNGLSAIPRMLDGFGDPEYVKTGATFYRISDPGQFDVLLDQARNDYPNYPFRSPGR